MTWKITTYQATDPKVGMNAGEIKRALATHSEDAEVKVTKTVGWTSWRIKEMEVRDAS